MDGNVCSKYPLRKTLSDDEINSQVYTLIANCSEDKLAGILKTVSKKGYEQVLTEVTGVDTTVEPSTVIQKLIKVPFKRIQKLLVLGK